MVTCSRDGRVAATPASRRVGHAIAMPSRTGIEVRVMDTTRSLLAAIRGPRRAPGRDPVEGRMPSLEGATGWLNSPPLATAGLRGRVVLVSFWTYTCINWLRTLPDLRAWDRFYRSRGLVVVSVHSPEFSFERDVDNVRRAADTRSIGFPVAIDNQFAVWRSFHNQYWPAVYLVDAQGRLRHHNFGEGGYDDTERLLRQLLTESGADDLDRRPPTADPDGVEAPAAWDTLRSAETYLGYDRTSGFASLDHLVANRPHRYSAPARLRPGQWALSGSWTVGGESATSITSGGRVLCRFHARDLHLVAAPAARESPVRFRLLLDGRAPGRDHGVDVDGEGTGTIAEPRLHQLLRRRATITDSTVEIEFLDPGVQLYAFTFG